MSKARFASKDEVEALRHVHAYARYYRYGVPLPDGRKGGKYAMEWNGEIYHSDDTRELVEKILERKSPNLLTLLTKSVALELQKRKVKKKTKTKCLKQRKS